MNLYSVLLVDDEEEVYSVIMKKLDWEAMGFRIAGYARNGVEALEMAEEIQPDVVMTDIKMPYMDGLTLSKKLKELYQKIKIIIFSGFDEFEYAKEAIKIEAEEYILKPINSNELREVFERIRTNLDRELDEKRNIEKLRAYYMESLPVLQENFYTSLIEGRIPASEIEKYLKQYQIPWSGPYYVATILHISTPDPQLELDPFLLGMSVKQLAEEQFVDKWRSNTFFYLGDILVITQLKETEEITAYTNAMDRFCKLAKRVCGAKVTAGIGPVCDEIAELPASYQGARNAVSYRVIYGNTRAINIAEIDPQGSAEEPCEEQSIGNILKKIKTGDEQALSEYLASQGRLRSFLTLWFLAVVQVLSLVIPAMPVQLAAGLAYGPWLGFVTSFSASAVANLTVFLAARRLAPVIRRLTADNAKATKLLNSVRSSKDPWFYTILAFITPGLPNGIIPYAAANAGMRPKHFIAAIFISLPFPTLLTCAAGSFILEGNWFFTVLTGIVLFSFVGILFFNRTKFIAWAHEMKDKHTKKAEA